MDDVCVLVLMDGWDSSNELRHLVSMIFKCLLNGRIPWNDRKACWDTLDLLDIHLRG